MAPPAALLTDLRDTVVRGSGTHVADVPARHGLHPLAGGLQNHVYAWESPADGPICLKLYVKGNHRRRVEREWAALTLLAKHDVSGVPRPLWSDNEDSIPAIGMTLLPGTSLLESPDREAALSGLAHTTQRLQSVPLSGLLAGLERIDSGAHYVNRLTNSWPTLLAGHEGDPMTAEMRARLTAWHDSGDAELLNDGGTGSVFSRGDSNLLNWLRDGVISACVDFEYSGYGTTFFDAADLIEHISARAISDTSWIELLPELGITPANRRHFLAAQRTCALRWLAVLWKQRHTRADQFAAQHTRVQLLQSPHTSWRG